MSKNPPRKTIPGLSPAASLAAFDQAHRKRIAIAIGVSLVVNAVVFGSAGVIAHHFLAGLRHRSHPDRITVTRIIIPAAHAKSNAAPRP
jgi:hypothetical protein